MHRKPTPTSSLEEIKRYTVEKYIKKRFAKEDIKDPVSILKETGSYVPDK